MDRQTKNANRWLICSLSLVVVLSSICMTACNVRDVVQVVENDLQTFKGSLNEAQALLPELQAINPELATIVSAAISESGPIADSAITACNNYLATPSGDKYQELLNATNALTQTVNREVLAAAHVKNTQSQAAALAALTVLSVSASGFFGYLKSKANASQLKAIPQPTTAQLNYEEIKKLIDAGAVRERLANLYGGDQAGLAVQYSGF